MTPMTIDEIFHKIAQATIGQADKVNCSAADYRSGLRHIIEEIRTAIQASVESTGEEE